MDDLNALVKKEALRTLFWIVIASSISVAMYYLVLN